MEGTSPRRALQGADAGGMENMPARQAGGRGNRRRRELLQRNNLGRHLQEIKKLLDEGRAGRAQRLLPAPSTTMLDSARCKLSRCRRRRPKAVQSSPNTTGDPTRRARSTSRSRICSVANARPARRRDERGAGNATDGDRQRVNDMLDDRNDLDKRADNDSPPGLSRLRPAKHGEFFPENPQNIDELLDSLAKRRGGRKASQQPHRAAALGAGCVGAT